VVLLVDRGKIDISCAILSFPFPGRVCVADSEAPSYGVLHRRLPARTSWSLRIRLLAMGREGRDGGNPHFFFPFPLLPLPCCSRIPSNPSRRRRRSFSYGISPLLLARGRSTGRAPPAPWNGSPAFGFSLIFPVQDLNGSSLDPGRFGLVRSGQLPQLRRRSARSGVHGGREPCGVDEQHSWRRPPLTRMRRRHGVHPRAWRCGTP
jgi:hypothetical protein